MKRTFELAAGFALAALAATTVAAATDEQWEMTTRMDMPGMKMPAITNTVCIPKDGAFQPENKDKKTKCEMLDSRVSGNKMTWKFRCAGKDPMTGEGEQTRTSNTMSGVVRMTAEGMTMTQTYSGKLVGTCDAAAERKKIEGMIAESTRQGCDAMLTHEPKNGGSSPQMPPMLAKGQCPGYKEKICTEANAYVATYEGYDAYRNRARMGGASGWVTKECGINLDAQRAKLCARAANEARYNFVGANCPAEANALFERNCKSFGRDYTADMANPNAGMCRTLRAGMKGQGGSASTAEAADETAPSGKAKAEGAAKAARKSTTAATTEKATAAEAEPQEQQAGGGAKPADAAVDAVKDATKKLKGLFGF